MQGSDSFKPLTRNMEGNYGSTGRGVVAIQFQN